MPVIVAWIIGALVSAVGPLVARGLVAAGIGYVTFSGVDTLLTYLKAMAIQSLTSMPPQVAGLMALLKLDVCISMMFSALAVRLTLATVGSGLFTRTKIK